MLIPAYKVRQHTNIALPMQFYRACCEIMDSTTRRATNSPTWYPRRETDRGAETNRWCFDIHVGIGLAYGAYGSNFCVLPHSGYGEFATMVFSEKGWLSDAWGMLYELEHHHQTGWRFPDDGVGEVTNNVLVMLC